jgi:hypothetical protein
MQEVKLVLLSTSKMNDLQKNAILPVAQIGSELWRSTPGTRPAGVGRSIALHAKK